MTEQPKLDWTTAEVSDGELTVRLRAKLPKRWRATFERTATLLNSGSWDVSLNARNHSVRVASVQSGDEERVRQFLEGAVLEANSTLVSERELFEVGPADDEDEPTSDTETAERSRDEELTAQFRGFAQAPDGEEDAGGAG